MVGYVVWSRWKEIAGVLECKGYIEGKFRQRIKKTEVVNKRLCARPGNRSPCTPCGGDVIPCVYRNFTNAA